MRGEGGRRREGVREGGGRGREGEGGRGREGEGGRGEGGREGQKEKESCKACVSKMCDMWVRQFWCKLMVTYCVTVCVC